jgi:tetratricopeptide (TPR) repeat protein
LTDWNRYHVYETVLQRVADAPFTNQSNSLTRQKTYRERLLQLKSGLNPAALTPARENYQEALSSAPDDFFLRRKFAELLEMAGDLSGALTEWERVRDLLPHHPIPCFQLGRLLARLGKSGEAEEQFKLALGIRADFVEALDELGQVLARQEKWEQGIARFHQALRLQPDNATLHFHLADALAAHGKRTEALASLREAIRLRPGYWEARYLLGVELAIQEKIDEAGEQFNEVVRLRPDYALGHLNLGVAFARQGKMNEALAEFQATLRLDPKNQAAQRHIEKIQLLQTRQR